MPSWSSFSGSKTDNKEKNTKQNYFFEQLPVKGDKVLCGIKMKLWLGATEVKQCCQGMSSRYNGIWPKTWKTKEERRGL